MPKAQSNLDRMAAECGILDHLESMRMYCVPEIEILRYVTSCYQEHVEKERAEYVRAITQEQCRGIGDRLVNDPDFMGTLAEIQDEEQVRSMVSSRIADEEALVRKDLELPIRLIRQGCRSVFIP